MIASTPDIDELLAQGAPVAIGISGGKDSCALAFALQEHLDAIQHSGPRLLIHSDLGAIEWRDSAKTCERLAKMTGLELVRLFRKAGGMIDRWWQRWESNVRRYQELACVQLILPWSTPSMRFCTSELKTDVICGFLKKRFRGESVISASGIRREESKRRARAPIAKRQAKLVSGWDWHPIIEWTVQDVLSLCKQRGFPLHEAYGVYGSSRVSCSFCIMATLKDLSAAAGCESNHIAYRAIAALEIQSTFAFQGGKWLADIAPHLLAPAMFDAITSSKRAATIRQEAEARIPRHLLYTAGWPTCIPTRSEAKILAQVRREVSDVVRLESRFLEADEIIGRYEELMRLKNERDDRARARRRKVRV
jgi:3'-phosphoadenosine 5'-phosphosulfate sulfotransferase (PAPS reductase)/FAD synthetase